MLVKIKGAVCNIDRLHVLCMAHWMASPEYQPTYFIAPEYQPTFFPPYNLTDCSAGVCTPFCPDWCFQIPPPPPFAFLGHQSDPNFSPLVIAIIGILASAFLLVSYYTIVSKYCTRWGGFRRRVQGDENDSSDDQRSPPSESWPLVTVGLEDSVIRSIPVCKYNRGDGLVESTDCSVCLSEFHENESLRLLPKCSHAFHLPCIDMWLQSHSNCPLCRANIVSPVVPLPAETAVTVPPATSDSSGVSESRGNNNPEQNLREGPGSNSLDGMRSPVNDNGGNVSMDRREEIEKMEREKHWLGAPMPSPFRAFSDLASNHRRDGDMVQLRGELQPIRRSVSMDSSHRLSISIADILSIHPGFEDDRASVLEHHVTCSESSEGKDLGCQDFVFNICNKHLHECQNKSEGRDDASKSGVSHNLKGPLTMKRSFSGGKFFFSRYNRGRNSILPL